MIESWRRNRTPSAMLVILIVGALLLQRALTRAPTDDSFYVWSAALAATWLIAGPGRPSPNALPRFRAGVLGAVLGLGLGLMCWGGAWVLQQLPVVADPVRSYVAEVAGQSSDRPWLLVLLVALLTGAAEEYCFRGALFTLLNDRLPGPRQGLRVVAATTTIYVLVTLATGNTMLVLASALLGAAAGTVRAITGQLHAAVGLHVVWSLTMVTVLPTLGA